MRPFPYAAALSLIATAAAAQPQCGGSFSDFRTAMQDEAIARGYAPDTVGAFFDGTRQDQATLDADRKQGVFTLPFTDFARRLISASRIDRGRANAREYAPTFDAIERDYGVSRGVLLAFWAFETDYGSFQGDFNTVNSLMTLAHDCRRPDLFRPQVFAALQLFSQGALDPDSTTGAWAGEIGMVQMLPEDIIENGVDADGNGTVDLKTSPRDALTSGGKMLQHLGWRANEPWLEEVDVPDQMDWSQANIETTFAPSEWQAMGVSPRDGSWDADLPASLVLPQGRNGPAFIAYPNFNVFFEWNQSFTYVLTAAYFANRLEGAPVFDAGNPPPPLSGAQMTSLQQKLAARGHDVGDIDGILGAGTRAAVRKEQQRLGLPADAWPTVELLNAL